jgi:hypothetical protein
VGLRRVFAFGTICYQSRKKKNVIEFIFELMNSMSSEWLVKVPSVRHQLARVPTTIVDPHSPVNALLLYYEIWFG